MRDIAPKMFEISEKLIFISCCRANLSDLKILSRETVPVPINAAVNISLPANFSFALRASGLTDGLSANCPVLLCMTQLTDRTVASLEMALFIMFRSHPGAINLLAFI